ncbi:MAG TPA: 5'/3'-nucleotidase SurE [Spirochaetaceae bacterium]|nr:5'/3'-nucleotidase SurE [Spirochaetaceae bacterium]
MNILITNDDGYDAAGIKALRMALESAGHGVLELAPSANQSAKSHSIRISGNMELQKHEEMVYSIDGTPADTVVFYDTSDYFPDFKADLVVSGINNGLNVSSDIIYSGTCAAAREASLRGHPAIALSCQVGKDGTVADYELAIRFLLANLDTLCDALKRKGARNFFLNINVPFGGSEDRFEYASLSPLDYSDIMSEAENTDAVLENSERFVVQFLHNETKVNESLRNKKIREVCDMDAVHRGIISVSFIRSFPSWDNSL